MSDPIRLMETTPEADPLTNEDAEAIVLGALMTYNDAVSRMSGMVEFRDFSVSVHERIYRTILQLVGEGRAANPVTLKPFFDNDEALEKVGGFKYLASLTGYSTPGASFAGNGGGAVALIGMWGIAQQIADLGKRRRLRDALTAVIAKTNDFRSDSGNVKHLNAFADPDLSIEKLVADIDAATNEAVQISAKPTTSIMFDAAWDKAVKHHDDVRDGSTPPGIAIDGLNDWNDLLGGMERGDLIVLAARPGMGKTAVACSIANSCGRAGYGTAFISLEMPVGQLVNRMISDACYSHGRSFKFQNLRRGKLEPFERRQIDIYRETVADWPIIFDKPAGATTSRILMALRRLARKLELRGKSLDVVLIDYLHLMKPDKDRNNQTVELGEITRALKLAAQELDCVIILLSQLNRGVEQRDDKRPQLSDLRQSGAIEQDADAVIFLYREEYYLKAIEPAKPGPEGDAKKVKAWNDWNDQLLACRDRIDLIAAKVRNGETGNRKAYFFSEYQAVRGSRFFTDGGY